MEDRFFAAYKETAREIARDVGLGRCVALLVPRTAAIDELAACVENEFIWAGFRSQLIRLSPGDAGESPPEYVLKCLEAKDSWKAERARDVVHHPHCPEAVLLQIDRPLAPAEALVWARFVVDWAETLQHDPPTRGPFEPKIVLVAVDQSDYGDALVPEVRLSIRSLSGCTSQIHLRSLLRDSLGVGGGLLDWLWADSVFVELAGWDARLLRRLVSEQPKTDGELTSLLEHDGRSRGWEEVELRRLGAEEVGILTTLNLLSPDRDWINRWHALWSEGVLDRVDEVGVELHSSAAALLNLDFLIRHRIWRGQVRLLLPLIDSARLSLSLRVDQYLSSGIQSGVTRKVREFPELSDTMGRNRDLLFAADGRLEQAVEGLRQVRNGLAHYRPLTRGEFRQCLQHAASAGRWLDKR